MNGAEDDEEETVLTSRRARLAATDGSWITGRLRISDRGLRFSGTDGTVVEIAAADVRAVVVTRGPRRALRVDTADGPLRLRCFAMPAIAALLNR